MGHYIIYRLLKLSMKESDTTLLLESLAFTTGNISFAKSGDAVK